MKQNKFNRRKFVGFLSMSLATYVGLKLIPDLFRSEWNLNEVLSSLKPGDTINLAETLPFHVKRGGVFSVDNNGAPLPTQISFNTEGVLQIGYDFSGHLENVVFHYEEPKSWLA